MCTLHSRLSSRPIVATIAGLATLLAATAAVSAQPTSRPAAPAARPRPVDPLELIARHAGSVEVRRDIPYAGTTSRQQVLDVYLPRKRSTDRPLPAILFIHGGGWTSGNTLLFAGRALDYAASGDFVCVCITYRGTTDGKWPAQIHDCKASVRWLRGHAAELGVDPDRIAAFGGSAGAQLALMMGVTSNTSALDGDLGEFKSLPSRVSCVVSLCGPSDLTVPLAPGRGGEYTAARIADLLGGPPAEKAEAARESSPMTYVAGDMPPVFILHGKSDGIVSFAQSVAFDEAVKKAGGSCTLVPMLGVDHTFTLGGEPLRRLRQFLDAQLRDVPSEIATTPIPRDQALARQ